MTRLPNVCVIGAGASGLAASKALQDGGFDFDCFETSDRVGGLWVFKNRNGMSAAYRSLHLNTSRERTQYADFPMPASYADFPDHTRMAEYFDAYADRFGLRERITFETSVTAAERRADGRWDVSTDTGTSRTYDALIVANGHHWNPRWPEPAFPGQDRFAGRQMHSHDYAGDDPDLFRGKSVVVLGMGNSAMDIAVDASYLATAVYLAARRGAWVLPKYLLGRPFDTFQASARIPFAVRQRASQALYKLVVGDMQRYGLQKPDHALFDAHPTISGDILSRLGHGEITPKPNIAALTERTVRFADGSEVPADVVVYCTGYKVTFPFLDPELISAPDNDLPLFRRVFHPDLPGIYFVGLLQPLGSILPLTELQAAWICDHLAGRYRLPDPAAMRADIEAERAAMFARYVRSKRHTMEVDFYDYVLALRKERRRGEHRAAEAGNPLPIAPAVPA